jgi:hypothetical protein
MIHMVQELFGQTVTNEKARPGRISHANVDWVCQIVVWNGSLGGAGFGHPKPDCNPKKRRSFGQFHFPELHCGIRLTIADSSRPDLAMQNGIAGFQNGSE